MTAGLLERERELARMSGRLGEARAGCGGFVVIEGPAGIGKTSLLRAVRALGHQTGMQVLDGRGSDLEGDFAFGVMRQALERPLAALDEAERSAVISGQATHAEPLFVAGQPVAGIDALLQGLYWLIANLAERTPALLAIDDVHWADGPSVAALAFLAGRLEQLPVALIVSTRPPDLDATKELTALVTDPAAERLVPQPLSAIAVAALGGTDDERSLARHCGRPEAIRSSSTSYCASSAPNAALPPSSGYSPGTSAGSS